MKKLSLIILALLAVLASCKKAPEVNLKYVDVEREVLTVGTTTATFQCDYQYIATLKSAKVYYGVTESGMSSKEMQVVSSSLYAEITGLASNTTYNYYYEFDNGYNSMQSAVKTFMTESITLPTVITADVTEITAESAVSGGNVTNDGDGTVTARGVCWSLNLNPTINDNFTTDGEGIGSFISNMTGLSDNTTYHIRAYAINEAGTAYGLDKEFTTSVAVPEGAINGLFTINENGDKVYFSQGNLQYIGSASTPYWKFAEHQWDYLGWTTGQNTDSLYVDRDLFGWGTSGYNHGAICYQPWSTSGIYSDYYAYGNSSYNLFDQTGQADWGYNPVSNGGNQPNQWRTLKSDEWWYVFNTRNTISGIRYAKAEVNGVNGVILLPDNWSSSYYSLNSTNNGEASFSSNTISASQWNTLEQHDAVFLPAAGSRPGPGMGFFVGIIGKYWSANSIYKDCAVNVGFGPGGIYGDPFLKPNSVNDRMNGYSVRLVCAAQ